MNHSQEQGSTTSPCTKPLFIFSFSTFVCGVHVYMHTLFVVTLMWNSVCIHRLKVDSRIIPDFSSALLIERGSLNQIQSSATWLVLLAITFWRGLLLCLLKLELLMISSPARHLCGFMGILTRVFILDSANALTTEQSSDPKTVLFFFKGLFL